MDEAMEHRKAARRLEMEIEHTAYYCDCVEFLHLALLEAKSLNKEEIEGKIREYMKFKKMTYENYKACASDKELLVVPGAGHGMSYFTDPEKYKKAVTDFCRRLD